MKNRKRGAASHGSYSKMISIRFPVDLLHTAKEQATRQGLTFSSVIVGLIEKLLEENNEYIDRL